MRKGRLISFPMRDSEWEMFCKQRESRNITQFELFNLIIEALEKEPISKTEKDKQKSHTITASWDAIDKLEEMCETTKMSKNALIVLGLDRISKP